jgi:nickel/cobalt exporter
LSRSSHWPRSGRMLVAMIHLFTFLQSTGNQTDSLTRLLHQQQLTPWMIAVAIGIAFVLGAAHALTPGHGKTIVAAYLVGSRGTLKHAAFLGAMVTFTHTVSVFLLGLATLFLFQYVVPQKVTQVLGAISGLSIVAIGGWMLYKRLRGTGSGHAHSHDHGHDHGHEHSHVHDHAHAHSHEHHHDHSHDHVHEHSHSDGPGGHTHIPDEISWSGLVALGVSGGLVPCESALVLLLTAIALRRVGLGLILLISFSLGLALVLMAIGVLVIYAKNLLPSGSGGNPFFRWMPVASAAVVMVLGVIMTAVSLGWIRPHWMAG